MKKRSLLFAIVAILALVLVVAACGGQQENEPSNANNDSNVQENVNGNDVTNEEEVEDEVVGDEEQLEEEVVDEQEPEEIVEEKEPVVPSVEQDIPSIAEVYADYFPIGAAVAPQNLTNPLFAELLKKHVNLLVAENVMKPDAMQPTEGNFRWDQADRIIEFAKENGMEVRFHTLVWHNQVPRWFFLDENLNPMVNETDPEKREANKKLLLERLETHVKTIVSRYKDDIKSWDVVNEVVEPGDPGGIRNSEWYQITGTEFIEVAFQAAREAGGPDIKLYINDYGTDDARKRDIIYDLVKEMLDKGVPIDGVGHQTHVNTFSPHVNAIVTSMRKFAELGLDNIVTELDMSLYVWNDRSDFGDDIPEHILNRQGRRYRDIFEAFKENKDILSEVVFWGITDRHTWLHDFPVKGRTDAPLPFDKNFHAKPAYWGIVDPSKLAD